MQSSYKIFTLKRLEGGNFPSNHNSSKATNPVTVNMHAKNFMISMTEAMSVAVCFSLSGAVLIQDLTY